MMPSAHAPSGGFLPQSQFSSFKIDFQKGREANEPRAKGMGCCRAELAARRFDGGSVMPKTSSPVIGKKLPLSDERDFAEIFSPIIEDLNMHKISRATGRSVETVKAWRSRRAFPNGASLINAARAFPTVKAWLLEQIETSSTPGGDATKMLFSLQRLADGAGPHAPVAQAILQEMHKPRGASE